MFISKVKQHLITSRIAVHF